MATEFARMQSRGASEAELLASTEVPLVREVVVASDTGRIWVGNGTDTCAALRSVVPPAKGSYYVEFSSQTNLPTSVDALAALDARFGAGGDDSGGTNPGAARVDYRPYNATTKAYPPAGNAPADQLLIWIGPTPPPVSGEFARQPSTWWRTV